MRRPRAGRSSSPLRVRRSSRIRTRGSSAGSTSARSCASSRRRTRRSRRTASSSPIPAPPRRWDGARGSASSTSTRTHTAHARSSTSSACGRRWAPVAEQPGGPGRIAIVPALNEEEAVGRVIDEIRAFDPGFDIVVVDDGSTDRTAGIAVDRGAHVLRLPFNLGIGGAMQTGFRYAFEHGYDVAVQVDGDGQHDPTELPKILGPVVSGRADLVVGTRFGGDGEFRSTAIRRVGIRVFAWTVSRIVGQRVTDTTSGFRAIGRRGIALFAADYPHDYPEVEATVMVAKARLRLEEVPVAMRERAGGRSSITALRSVYYMVKVLLALFIGLFRRYAVPGEEEDK